MSFLPLPHMQLMNLDNQTANKSNNQIANRTSKQDDKQTSKQQTGQANSKQQWWPSSLYIPEQAIHHKQNNQTTPSRYTYSNRCKTSLTYTYLCPSLYCKSSRQPEVPDLSKPDPITSLHPTTSIRSHLGRISCRSSRLTSAPPHLTLTL